MRYLYVTFLCASFLSNISAQLENQAPLDDNMNLSWRKISTSMSFEWYGSNEAINIAENLLIAQKEIGGWAKNIPYHHSFSTSEKAKFKEEKSTVGATFDNGATISELRFLVKVYAKTKLERFKDSCISGLNYIFTSQYDNGGWPQFYPVRKGTSVAYSGHITYNDNAMVNVMEFLKDIISQKYEFSSLQLEEKTIMKARKSFEKGIQCILHTQIIKNGKPTVWCAQHDAKTLAPANARNYELASFSGGESAGIVQLLMEIEKPTEEIIASIEAATDWFIKHQINGIKVIRETTSEGTRKKYIEKDENASPLWARFYDLETDKPFFCDRDGIKKNSLAEIGDERRNQYRWYTDAPEKVIKKYPVWKKKVGEK